MSMNSVNRVKSLIAGAAFLLSLSGCVTTTSSGPKVNIEKAEEANVNLGMTYLQKGNREGALRSFTKALKLNARSAGGHQGMALVHQLNGEYESAEASFKKALKETKNDTLPATQFSYGRFLYERKRCEEAVKHFDAAGKVLTFPRRASAIVYLGLCSKAGGDLARAKSAFEHAAKLNEREPVAVIELAEMAFENKDYSQAKRRLDQFGQIVRHTARSLWLGIRIERIFGNKDKEASYALALKNLHPYSKEYLEYKREMRASSSTPP